MKHLQNIHFALPDTPFIEEPGEMISQDAIFICRMGYLRTCLDPSPNGGSFPKDEAHIIEHCQRGLGDGSKNEKHMG